MMYTRAFVAACVRILLVQSAPRFKNKKLPVMTRHTGANWFISCPSSAVLSSKKLSTGLLDISRTFNSPTKHIKMKNYQLFSLLVVIVVVFSTALSCNPGAKTDEAGARSTTTPTPPPSDLDEDLNSGEFSGHECGPVHGKCPYSQCCSLRNECGNSTSHCNLSLGCKKKWGICH